MNKKDLQPNRERRIKKHIYGQHHSVELIALPGFQDTALAECKTIIGEHNARFDRTHIRVDEVAFDDVLKLVYLAKTIDDVWFELASFRFKGLVALPTQLETSLLPLAFLQGTALEFKIDIIKSHFQDKVALQKSLKKCLEQNTGSGSGSKTETKIITLQVRLFRDVLSIFVPLAGEPLYKRGYRSPSATVDAPLRETIAQSVIQTFFNQHPHLPPIDRLFVPFGGSGTFLFEYWLWKLNSINHANRQLQFEKLAFFPPAKTAHLIKKSLENANTTPLASVYCDVSEKACKSFQKNLEKISTVYSQTKSLVASTSLVHDDFIQSDFSAIFTKSAHLFIPLNPPYGVRLKKQSVDEFYKKISIKLETLASTYAHCIFSGVVLCPSESTWQHLKNSLPSFKTATSHFMQGGLDVRLMTFTTVFT